MSQKNLIINGLEFNYKGIFRFDELYDLLGKSLEELGYKRHEKRFEESVKETGKDLFIELRPTKPKTAYLALMIKIRMEMKGVHNIHVEVDGIQTPFQEGEIHMLFDAWVTIGYNQRWNMNPVFYLLKAMVNKYIYRFPLEGGASGEVASDTHLVMQKVKSYLNLHKYKLDKNAEEGH